VRAIAFTVWRHEVTEWMLSLHPAMQGPLSQALAPATQALWWSMAAYLLGVRQHPLAQPAARRAVELWRPLGNAAELQIAVVNWVRAFSVDEPGLDAAAAALQEVWSLDTSPRGRLRVNGARAVVARLRDDFPTQLVCHEEELLAARELGLRAHAQAAENNLCVALVRLGRHADALPRAQALLQTVDADGGDDNGNLPWVLNILLEALVGVGRLDEATALVPRSRQAAQRFATAVAWVGFSLLVAAREHAPSAARLLGYLDQRWRAESTTLDPQELLCLARLREAASGLDGTQLALLEAEGRGLDEEAAAVLVLG
jgi:non-specific serine/threonine protein kinase